MRLLRDPHLRLLRELHLPCRAAFGDLALALDLRLGLLCLRRYELGIGIAHTCRALEAVAAASAEAGAGGATARAATTGAGTIVGRLVS